MSLLPKIESILFVASKPVSIKTLAKVLSSPVEEVSEALKTLVEKYNTNESGINIIMSEQEAQMTSSSAYSELVEQFTKSEILGELTPAQLETLTVVAYRQPVTRPELEQIRGVNCSVILRNLMQRGLVEEESNKDMVMPAYRLSVFALRHLGVTKVEELPHFDEFHAHEHINATLEQKDANATEE